MSISVRLKTFLDENQIPYSVVMHTTAYTAQGTAATLQISGKELAKSVVLWTGEEMILAVLPAPNHVRLDQLGAEVGKSLRLATEQEFSSLFPDCEPGAMPPFGSLYNLPAYVDESLAADEAIVFNAGTHRETLFAWRSPRYAHSLRKGDTNDVVCMVCVARSSSLRSSVGGIELAPGRVAGVAIWGLLGESGSSPVSVTRSKSHGF